MKKKGSCPERRGVRGGFLENSGWQGGMQRGRRGRPSKNDGQVKDGPYAVVKKTGGRSGGKSRRRHGRGRRKFYPDNVRHKEGSKQRGSWFEAWPEARL